MCDINYQKNYLYSDFSILYKIKDISLFEVGSKRMELSRNEMPGLVSIQEKYCVKKPLSGLKVTGSLHMTIETAVLIETLKILGADIRWCSCNVFSTQDDAAAVVVKKGLASVFAWKGESIEEYWWCMEQSLIWPDMTGPDLIVDDGGDATLFIHQGYISEQDNVLYDKKYISYDMQCMMNRLKIRHIENPRFWEKISSKIKGVSEETTTGVRRLNQLSKDKKLLFPAFNVNDSVTKSKFDNLYGCRESLPDGLKRATNIMIAGKVVVVCGFGDVGKGCANAMSSYGARVLITEIDPICALQAVMEGYQVVILKDVVETVDIFITATGCCNVITGSIMEKMKTGAVVCNIGHFDNEIEMFYLESEKDCFKNNIKAQVDEWTLKSKNSIIVLAEGRLVNLGCAHGHSSFVMSSSFTNQCLAQIELAVGNYEKKVYVLPKIIDEKVAKLHLKKLGVNITALTKKQSNYLGISIDGPYKPDTYRY